GQQRHHHRERRGDSAAARPLLRQPLRAVARLLRGSVSSLNTRRSARPASTPPYLQYRSGFSSLRPNGASPPKNRLLESPSRLPAFQEGLAIWEFECDS